MRKLMILPKMMKKMWMENVCDIAWKASIPSAKVTDDVIEDLIDEFCSDEEYFKEVEESLDIFKLTHQCLPYESCKGESEF